MSARMTDTEALALSRVLYREGGERERKLGEACNAAERSRLYILKHYGDPADWPDASGRRMYYERAVIPHLEGRAALAPEARHD